MYIEGVCPKATLWQSSLCDVSQSTVAKLTAAAIIKHPKKNFFILMAFEKKKPNNKKHPALHPSLSLALYVWLRPQQL